MKLLLIEDSARLRESLTIGLSNSGYIVDSTGDGDEGLRYALSVEYDLIILDLMLPSLDGLLLLKKLRERGKNTNVLILSAKDQIEYRIKGLNLGADDYLCKPFSYDELLARINSIIRRSYGVKSTEITVNRVVLDTVKKEVRVDDKPLILTSTEYAIMELLALKVGRVVTYQSIENHVYPSAANVTRNAIEAHVSSLRKKIKSSGVDKLIKTRRGFGYIIEK